jgi:cellulose synthase/poly-beta-1,6-N-acetylglucosamine synthase-like glycosyltransferase
MAVSSRRLLRSVVQHIPAAGALLRERDDVRRELAGLRRQVGELGTDLRDIRDILQFVYDDGPANRDRLWALRASPEYELAFTEERPLVSVVITTYDRLETLLDVSIPSVLAQTYEDFELIVVGDCAPPETGEAVAAIGDPRISYYNRERRGPYPRDPRRYRRVKGGPPYNEGVRRARGRWLARLDDDDAYRPHALETLVHAVKENRWEYCRGRFFVAGQTERPKPPELPGSLTAALYHAGLGFIEFELADAVFFVCSDRSVVRRMYNYGVRMGALEEMLVDFDPLGLTATRDPAEP